MQTYSEFKLSEVFKSRIKKVEKKKGMKLSITFKRMNDVNDFIQWAQTIRREAEKEVSKETDLEIKSVIRALNLVISLADQNMLDRKHLDVVTPEILKEAAKQRRALVRVKQLKERLEARDRDMIIQKEEPQIPMPEQPKEEINVPRVQRESIGWNPPSS